MLRGLRPRVSVGLVFRKPKKSFSRLPAACRTFATAGSSDGSSQQQPPTATAEAAAAAAAAAGIGRATPRARELYVCKVEIVAARGLVNEGEKNSEEKSAFYFLNPWAGNAKLSPFARVRLGLVSDLEAPLIAGTVAEQERSVDNSQHKSQESVQGFAPNDATASTDGFFTPNQQHTPFHIEYDKSMDLGVELWNRVRGFDLGFSGDGSDKSVCLGQVNVPLSKLFDGRTPVSIDQWFDIGAPPCRMIETIDDGTAPEASQVQHSYYLVNDEDDADESHGASKHRPTFRPDTSAVVESLTQAQRRQMQEEEDAVWEGKEGSVHHKNTWLGLRKLFVARPPKIEPTESQPTGAKKLRTWTDSEGNILSEAVELARTGTTPPPPKPEPLVGAQMRLRVSVLPQSQIDVKMLINPQPLDPTFSPPEKRLLERIHDFTIPGARGRRFRILSLDGGGMRGVFVSVVLQRLVARFPTLLQEVDLIAGTSTGAILTALLATGYPPATCTAIYRRHLAEVFKSETYRRVRTFISAKYSPNARLQLMEKYIGNRTLADLSKHVAITAFKMDGSKDTDETFFPSKTWRPALFTNLPKGSGRIKPDLNLRVVDAVMRSSAAPTYFPMYQGYVDGGVFANNPSLVALARVVEQFPELNPTHEMLVLSMGAGDIAINVNVDDDPNADWGFQQWGPKLVDLMMQAPPMQVDLVMRTLMKGNYHRFDTTLPSEHMGLDNVESMDALMNHAYEVDLEGVYKFLREKMELVESKAP